MNSGAQYFATSAAFRIWLRRNHRTETELQVDARPNPTSKGYTYDGMNAVLDTVRLRAFKKRKAAWNYFEAQPPGYRRKLVWWVMSAKRDETRDRRLDKLIESSAAGVRLM